jgi:spore germination protein GerM
MSLLHGRPWRLVAVLVAGAVLASCGVPTDSEARRLDDVPFGLVAPTTEVSGTVPEDSGNDYETTLYFVRNDNLRLVPVEQQIGRGVTPQEQAMIVLAALGAGPPANLPLRTVLRPTEELEVSVRGSLAIVELDQELLDITAPSEQLFAIGQMVLSLTRISPILEVEFRSAGRVVVVPLPDRPPAGDPVTAIDYLPLLT